MNKDNFYIFDKLTKKSILLGEIQADFNMSFVIDGTKDSCSVLVWSYEDYEIEPYTICWHEKTNTWWIVSHDKIERYFNDRGYLYIHNLELLGAIELFNARDLTDCGFNSNRYTVNNFLMRLLGLSNLEYDIAFHPNVSQTFLTKDVDFVKTFENYTLLSALREFLDAYNMCPKLTFNKTYNNSNGKYTITYGVLNIIPKTGDSLLQTHNIDEFEDARETKSMDKNSFGTCVVSNAENVISNKEKIYPSTGTVKFSGTQDNITPSNAVIRLPSKVFKGNWIKIIYNVIIDVEITGGYQSRAYIYHAYNDRSFFKIIRFVYNHLMQDTVVQPADPVTANGFIENITPMAESLISDLNKIGAVTLYEGNKLVPTFSSNSSTVAIKKGDDVPYLTKMSYTTGQPKVPYIFTDKETKELLPRTYQGICWERGSNIISGFELFDHINPNDGTGAINQSDTDYQGTKTTLYDYTNPTTGKRIKFILQTGMSIAWKTASFIVSYIPMTDIKIKVDNQRDKKDVQLYNQNGKITDNFALSKLLNSYSKEISSDNIVRYMQYLNYDDIPKIGSIVIKNNQKYVINNISMTFSQNENTNNDFGYFIDCEFNMSKWVSTKSLLVNPNTNIRDYGIPQNFNVKRKQLYRDYYELGYETNDDTETEYYLEPINIFDFTHEKNELSDFIATIKMTYKELVGGDTDTGVSPSYNWYYQLDTTNYFLNKTFYVVLDFNDNNIIGYGAQNVFSGFDISRIFTTGLTDTLNTPISYVDDDGEAIGIHVKLSTKSQLTETYDDYQDEEGYESNDSVSLYNISVFIPQEIFDNVDPTIEINEQNYLKDALEIPVFEYACQLDDSQDVLIGDNILTQYSGNIKYFYTYVKGQNLTQDNVSQSNRVRETTSSPLGWSISDGADIQYERYSNKIRLLRLTIYLTQFLSIDDEEWHNQNQRDFEEGFDYAFFRHAYNFDTKEEIVDLLFIAKAIPSTHISLDDKILTLEINHYKLN